MPIPVLIPKATITMEDALIVRWLKQAGEMVRADEMLFEMETDKVVVEVPAPASGVLLRIDVINGRATLDQPIAWIGNAGDSIPEPAVEDVAAKPVAPPAIPSAAPATPPVAPATPSARRRAKELGIDIAVVKGTGPSGRITESDVEAAKENDD